LTWHCRFAVAYSDVSMNYNVENAWHHLELPVLAALEREPINYNGSETPGIKPIAVRK
jgi:hypothetical protein